jgi:thioredoxin reductase (NADPH)
MKLKENKVEETDYDVVILGAGPAGISAGLYAHRGGLKTLILNNPASSSALSQAHMISNYYGFPDGITGKDLFDNGIMQAKNLGIEVKDEEVVDLSSFSDHVFLVKTSENEYSAKAIIIALGDKKQKPDIKGIDEYTGKGVSYCAVCDGFFYKGKDVAVIGDGNYALNEIEHLQNVVGSVTLFTNGKDIAYEDIDVDTRKIDSISGDNKVETVNFADGTSEKIDGIFIAIGTAGGTDLATKMGVLMDDNIIVVNEKMETNVPGIYACGNITGGLLQVNKAAYEGAQAGLNAIVYVKTLNITKD